MAKLSKEDVLKLARLAQLDLDDDEVAAFQTEISQILSYVEQLQEADVSGEEPTYQVTGLTNVFRADEPRQYTAAPEALLENAPAVQDNLITVQRMIQ